MTSPDYNEIYRRVDRAASNRREVDELAIAHLSLHPLQYDLSHTPRLITLNAITPAPFPVDVALSFSDWAHQLRASLDALLYQLAVGATGQNPPPDPNLLQYPLESTPEKFRKIAARRLKHLPQRLIDEIENTQPYKIPTGERGHGLWWLHELAKVDRHRMAHEFAWNIRGVSLTGPVLKGSYANHCDELETYVRSGEETLLSTIRLAPNAFTGKGLDIEVMSWPEIPRWHQATVPSYRQYGLLDRMEGIEEIVRITTRYFDDLA